MKRSMTVVAAAVVTIVSGVSAHAGLIDFTDPGSTFTNTGPIPPTYQPLSGEGITVTYTDVFTYNGNPPDHTSGLAGTANYYGFAFDGNTMTFDFSGPVNIPSLWLKGFNGNNPLTLKAYSDAGVTQISSFTYGATSGWLQSTDLATLFNVRRITLGSGDAPNIDDITVNAVPEPASLVLLGLGAIGLVLAARRRRKA